MKIRWLNKFSDVLFVLSLSVSQSIVTCWHWGVTLLLFYAFLIDIFLVDSFGPLLSKSYFFIFIPVIIIRLKSLLGPLWVGLIEQTALFTVEF